MRAQIVRGERDRMPAEVAAWLVPGTRPPGVVVVRDAIAGRWLGIGASMVGLFVAVLGVSDLVAGRDAATAVATLAAGAAVFGWGGLRQRRWQLEMAAAVTGARPDGVYVGEGGVLIWEGTSGVFVPRSLARSAQLTRGYDDVLRPLLEVDVSGQVQWVDVPLASPDLVRLDAWTKGAPFNRAS